MIRNRLRIPAVAGVTGIEATNIIKRRGLASTNVFQIHKIESNEKYL